MHTGLIIDDGQLVVVQKLGSENGVPIRRTQTVFAKVVAAAFKLNGEFHIGVHNQVFRDGVVLEGSDGHCHRLDATDVAVAHDERLSRIEGVFAVNAHVLHIVHVGLFVLRLDAEGGGDVDIVKGLFLNADHTQ